jgi:hypothetical protein
VSVIRKTNILFGNDCRQQFEYVTLLKKRLSFCKLVSSLQVVLTDDLRLLSEYKEKHNTNILRSNCLTGAILVTLFHVGLTPRLYSSWVWESDSHVLIEGASPEKCINILSGECLVGKCIVGELGLRTGRGVRREQ